MFDPKIILRPHIAWGGLVILGVIITTTVKVMTRNHIHRREAYKNFETKERSDERYDVLCSKIEAVDTHISTRFEDIKALIEKSGK